MACGSDIPTRPGRRFSAAPRPAPRTLPRTCRSHDAARASCPAEVGASAGRRRGALGGRRDLVDVVLALFAARTLAAAKRGLPRAYLGREEELPLLRGSLDLTRHLTRRAGRPERLACRFDELSPDIALNQVIAAALTQARRLARRDATRRALSEVAARYDEVSIPRRPLALSPALGRGLMADRTRLTKHARDRSTARDIPQGVIDLILAYGISSPARDGARRHALD
ncbi:MAG: hypothetical protein CML46_11040 [Rhodobacteraceae bacterium]|nr:hypothetical protein [Paracoccaceae bacterium]MBR27462.1 hypothetical protein [Paracoccaceae bacterium]